MGGDADGAVGDALGEGNREGPRARPGVKRPRVGSLPGILSSGLSNSSPSPGASSKAGNIREIALTSVSRATAVRPTGAACKEDLTPTFLSKIPVWEVTVRSVSIFHDDGLTRRRSYTKAAFTSNATLTSHPGLRPHRLHRMRLLDLLREANRCTVHKMVGSNCLVHLPT